MKPISPKDIKRADIPDFVIEAFNELIAKNYKNGTSTVGQYEVVQLIVKKAKEGGADFINSTKIYEEHWLDVEDLYARNGWIVEYDKPGYNESYEATFCFKKKPPPRKYAAII